MFDETLNRGKHKRKSGRLKSFNQWLLYSEEEDFEVYEPHPKKRIKDGAYRGEFGDYLPRDPKRSTRKQPVRRSKWPPEKNGYST